MRAQSAAAYRMRSSLPGWPFRKLRGSALRSAYLRCRAGKAKRARHNAHKVAGHGASAPLPALRDPWSPINFVGTALERLGKAPESGLEHRAHQHGEHAAAKFVGDEELYLAGPLPERVKVPAVLHAAERAAQVFDQDLPVRLVERHTRREGLVDDLVGHRHLGDRGFDPLRAGRPPTHPHRLAERHELRIALHVGDQIEHVARRMADAPPGAELRHQRESEARAAFRRAKSSPAWCEERVSGEADTIRKPLA